MNEMVERVARAWGEVVVIWSTDGREPAYLIIDRNMPHDGVSPVGGKIVYRQSADFKIYEECGLDRAPFGLMVRLRDFGARAVIAAMREPTEAMLAVTPVLNDPNDTSALDVWHAMIDAALK